MATFRCRWRTCVLGRDPDVAAWSGAYFDSVEINGRSVPVIGAMSNQIHPPILAGHLPAGPRQIALGEETLDQVGGRVGGMVRVFNGQKTLDMRIAGVTTLPAIGIGHGIHPALGTGALVPASALPSDLLTGGLGNRALQGPNTILVRFRLAGGQNARCADPPGGIAGELNHEEGCWPNDPGDVHDGTECIGTERWRRQ